MSGTRDNSGALFRNNRKTQDNHPDHTGHLTVDGKEFWVSAWIKTSKDGQRYFSLATKPKEPAQGTAAPASKPADLDDDIPF